MDNGQMPKPCSNVRYTLIGGFAELLKVMRAMNYCLQSSFPPALDNELLRVMKAIGAGTSR